MTFTIVYNLVSWQKISFHFGWKHFPIKLFCQLLISKNSIDIWHAEVWDAISLSVYISCESVTNELLTALRINNAQNCIIYHVLWRFLLFQPSHCRSFVASHFFNCQSFRPRTMTGQKCYSSRLSCYKIGVWLFRDFRKISLREKIIKNILW